MYFNSSHGAPNSKNISLRKKWASAIQKERQDQGKNSIHHHRGTPPFSQSKKTMVYTILLGKQRQKVYTIGPERRVYTVDPQTLKKRVSMVMVYAFFFPEDGCKNAIFAHFCTLPPLCADSFMFLLFGQNGLT